MAAQNIRLALRINMLKEIAKDYQGKTIDNIIQQMEARLKEIIEQETI